MLSEDQLEALEAAANAVENQAAADPNTSWKDRVKKGGIQIYTSFALSLNIKLILWYLCNSYTIILSALAVFISTSPRAWTDTIQRRAGIG